MVTVKDLIVHLQTIDRDLPVAYKCFSEQVLLELEDIEVEKHVVPRNDGWIQNWRKDLATQDYLMFPGN